MRLLQEKTSGAVNCGFSVYLIRLLRGMWPEEMIIALPFQRDLFTVA